MSKFITISVINAQTKQNDTAVWIRVEDIRQVMVPVESDRRQRQEINSLVITNQGTYASQELVPDILQKIEEAER